jgi:hypothetical protein
MGLEVLTSGDLRVRRDDANELSAIRDGAMSFDELLAQADSLRSRMETAAQASSLPADIDTDSVDALVESMIAGGPGAHGAVRG